MRITILLDSSRRYGWNIGVGLEKCRDAAQKKRRVVKPTKNSQVSAIVPETCEGSRKRKAEGGSPAVRLDWDAGLGRLRVAIWRGSYDPTKLKADLKRKGVAFAY